MATKNWKDIVNTVREDIRCHRENGVDLNPYSTNRARTSWVEGFDGAPMTILTWADEYQRGRVCRQLLDEENL